MADTLLSIETEPPVLPGAGDAAARRGKGLTRRTREFLTGLSWVAAFFTAARAATFLTQFLAARFLGPAEYGIAHMVIGAAALLQVLPMLGFPLALSRFGSLQDTDAGRRRVISTLMLSFIVWCGICVIVIIPFSEAVISNTRLGRDVWIPTVCYAFLTAFYLVTVSALQGLRRFKERGIAEAVYGALSTATLCAMVLAHRQSYAALIFSFIVGLTAGSFYALVRLRSYLRPHAEWALLTAALPFASLGALNVLSSALIQAPGRLIVYQLCSAQDAGIYSAYFTASAQIAQALTFMLYAVAVPLASEPTGQAEAWRLLRRKCPLGLLAALLVFSASTTGAIALAGKGYPLRLDWVLAFSAAAAATLLHGAISILLASRDLKGLLVSSVGTLIAGLGNAGFIAFLAPRWGVSGGACALLVGYALGLLWYAVFLPKHE